MSRANRNIKSRGSHLPKVSVVLDNRLTASVYITPVGATKPIGRIVTKSDEVSIMNAVRKVRGFAIS